MGRRPGAGTLPRAFDGDAADLIEVADEYGAGRIVLARRNDRWGSIQQVAATAAADPGRISGPFSLVDGNGWDAVTLDRSARLAIVSAQAGGSMNLEIRFTGDNAGADGPGSPLSTPRDRTRRGAGPWRGRRPAKLDGRLAGDQPVPSTSAPARRSSSWPMTRSRSSPSPVFVAMEAPAGWRVAETTSDAVVLEEAP